MHPCAAALGYCGSHPRVEAILLDTDMPVLNGMEFLARLRGDPALPQPPVVMCTTHSSLTQIRTALSLGADEYIMKPFDADILGPKLAEIGVQ